MSYEFHNGDLYFERLDQNNNSHGDYENASVAEVLAWLAEQKAGETLNFPDGVIDIEAEIRPGLYYVIPLDGSES